MNKQRQSVKQFRATEKPALTPIKTLSATLSTHSRRFLFASFRFFLSFSFFSILQRFCIHGGRRTFHNIATSRNVTQVPLPQWQACLRREAAHSDALHHQQRRRTCSRRAAKP